MLRVLIKIANRLDQKGFTEEADYIDGVITEVHGKMPEYLEEKSMYGSELGDFSDLDDTNITPGEAFGVGHAVAEHNSEKSGGHIHEEMSYMAKPQLARIEESAYECYSMIEDNEQLKDWMESHIAQAEQLITSVHKALKHQKHMYKVQRDS